MLHMRPVKFKLSCSAWSNYVQLRYNGKVQIVNFLQSSLYNLQYRSW